MDNFEDICYQCVKLRGLTAQCILGGIVWSSILFETILTDPAFANIWVVLALGADDAGSNNRMVAHLENRTEHRTCLIFLIICVIHRLHTATKVSVKRIDSDALFRWSNVFRIQGYRRYHWSLITKYVTAHWNCVETPPRDPVHNQMLRALLELTVISANPGSKYYANLADAFCSFFTHDVRQSEILVCPPDHCPTKQASLRCGLKLIYRLMYRRRMEKAKRSDWAAIWNCACKIVTGYCVHKLYDLLAMSHARPR